MYHRLKAGYFDADAVKSSRTLLITRPIDLDVVARILRECNLVANKQYTQDEWDVIEIKDGYIDCPWLSPLVDRRAVEFMIRLHEATGCMFADLNHGAIISVDELHECLRPENDPRA